jgi:hypothetical protein
MIIGAILGIIGTVIGLTWWLWLFIIFLPLSLAILVFWRQEHFKRVNMANEQCVVLELRIPREIKKSARAMEQVLASMATLRSAAGNFKDHYVDGKVVQWFSLEIASFGSEIHFYIRVPAKFRNMVEAPLFSYYNDVEVVVVPDYITRLPQDTASMYEAGQDLWGAEIVTTKDPAIPIRTYAAFETLDEETQFDPIATMLEVLAKLKPGEMFALQILIAPAPGNKWAPNAGGVLKVLRGEAKPSSGPTGLAGVGHAVREVATEIVMMAEEVTGKPESRAAGARTPGETDLIKAVENNVSKPGFETLIRLIYTAPKDIFSSALVASGVTASFNQYSAVHMNSFAPNGAAGIGVPKGFPYGWKAERAEHRKSRMLYNFRNREVPPETWMGKLFTSTLFSSNFGSRRFGMNTESLATIFHPPTSAVLTAPHVRRMDSRKVGPAAGLGIYGDEAGIEKFL